MLRRIGLTLLAGTAAVAVAPSHPALAQAASPPHSPAQPSAQWTAHSPAHSSARSPAHAPNPSSAPDPNAPKGGRVVGVEAFTPNARNAKAVRAFAQLHQTRRAGVREQIHHFWGVEPAAGTHDGMMASQSVDPSYKVSYSQDFTYTPTIKAAASCMEITTVYSQAVGNELWAWDWCGGDGPKVEKKMDATFMSTYTADVNGLRAYSVQLVRTNAGTNAWSSYLYNYTTAKWDLFFSKSGRDTSGLSYGWNIFEIYASRNPRTGTAYYCTDAAKTVFESSSIKLRRGGAWTPATPTDSPWQPYTDPDPSDYLCPSLKFIRAGANDHWIVRH
ncbi:carbohydrate-binding protein [Actinomadura barringtoniae]|uniref:Carbohydrate-binding protein n=1 Tax=Actinomadura barringtoniae TaxID=1427535 RepID=A0A939P7K5_9ACTN|nr:carbohydrate-binding protein [Actinomadura barringtoniae]MBO2447252.1 carbohydrate-binding protein [Actinomadura barringtoniae]